MDEKAVMVFSAIVFAACAFADVSVAEHGGDINAAIDAVAEAGGGRVLVPEGEWASKGPIRLKSGVELHLEKDAKIVFSDDPADYLPAVDTTWEGIFCRNYSPLVYAYGCTNVSITGGGTFAPKMGTWKKWFARPQSHRDATAWLYYAMSTNMPVSARDVTKLDGANMRPYLMQFNKCANVLLDGFKIRSSPMWCVHLLETDDVQVRNLDIYAHGHNNDGIDIEYCRNVLVENCRFDQGDDAVVIKAGRNQDAWRLGKCTENVEIRNCEIVDGHVLLGIGSEMSGGVRNVWMHDCKMTGSALNVFYMKTNERRGGFIENIKMENCTVEAKGRHRPKSVVGIETGVLYQWAALPTFEVKPTRIRNIVAENVHVNHADHLVFIDGDARSPVEGVTMRNVTCDRIYGEKTVIRNAVGVSLDGEQLCKAQERLRK